MSTLDVIRSRKGLLASFAAIFVFATSNTLVFASGKRTPPLLITVWNSASIICLSLTGIALTTSYRITDQIDRVTLCHIVITGVLKGLGDVALTSANVLTTPADAIAILNTAPIFTIIFSILFLRARCRWTDALVTALAITGVAFMTRPPILGALFGENIGHSSSDPGLNLVGLILALISAALNGLTMVFGHYVGFVRDTQFPLLIVLFIGITECCVGITASSMFHLWAAPENILDAMKLVGVGSFGFLGMFFLFYAVSNERATVVAIVLASEVILQFLAQQIFFDIPPHFTEAIGALLIVAACVGTSLERICQTVEGIDYDDREGEVEEEEEVLNQPLIDGYE